MLTDFPNPFISELGSKFSRKPQSTFTAYLKRIAIHYVGKGVNRRRYRWGK